MRRLSVILIVLGLLVSGGLATSPVSAAPAAGGVGGSENARRGLVYTGLHRSAPDGPCRGRYELSHREGGPRGDNVLCTHGPDPAPEGVDVRVPRAPAQASAAGADVPASSNAAASSTVPCYGNGTDGYRVQLIYALPSGAADRYATYANSFAMWAGNVDAIVNASAAETGGIRHGRFVTDATCAPVISRVAVSTAAANDFDTTISELRTLGFNRTDRKYLVWMDAGVYCGIGQVYLDDSPSTVPGANASNGDLRVPGEVARVDNGCWGLTDAVEAHELIHTLGGVQSSAPNATPSNHCTDESDRMCYADGSIGAVMRQICPSSHESRLDCNHDDYFSTAAPVGSYLATHWNTASSAFLATADPVAPPLGARYNPLSPSRILDTRTGNGAPAAKVGSGNSIDLQVTGRGGVPASGVSAVVLNVTVTDPTASGYLTVWPTGEALPIVSNLNFAAGQTVANLVVVKLGAGGKVSLYNSAGLTHLIADVAGWYDNGTAVTGARYNPLSPSRILDTRSGNGAPAAKVGAGSTLTLQVAGRGGVPASGVSAVVLNVTVTDPTASGYLTVWPTGEALPTVSNLNFAAGQTVPNLVVAKLGSGGKVSLYNSAGQTHLIADVAGWYDNG